MKKVLGYFLYVLSVVFIIRYVFQSFPALIGSFTEGVSSILLKLFGVVINFSFVFILFRNAQKLTRNQAAEMYIIKPVSLIKRIMGYLLFLIGILISVSILGNIYLYYSLGFPNTFMGIVNNIIPTIVFLVIVIESFRYGRKWTKKEQARSIEIDEIGKV